MKLFQNFGFWETGLGCPSNRGFVLTGFWISADERFQSMSSKRFLFPFVGCMTVLFLVGMSGCGKSPIPGSGIEENPAYNPQPPWNPPNSQNPPNTPNPAWYVSSGGNDSGAGTDPSKPVASVQTALARISSLYRSGKWKAGESAVIVVSGAITASGSFGSNQSMIDISGASNYPPIILEGDPVTGGVLNANRNSGSQGRVLYIANNKVTLGGNLTLTGGYTLWGGAVCVGTAGSSSEGEFIMTGGEISGNTAGLGGGVLVYKGSMTMTGGIIKNNVTTDSYSQVPGSGGGVYLNEYTSLDMTGGTISGNGGAKTDNGGGVLINGHARFTMTSGEILVNTSNSYGGGVHIAPYGEFTMSGGIINGNASAEGGGVYKSPYSAVFTQTGGTVSGNTPN
jgi:hypothetical protein